MRRSILPLFLLLASCAPTRYTRPDLRADVTILHWNDFHAQNLPLRVTRTTAGGQDTSYTVGGTATLLGYIDSLRREKADVALLNAGDDFQGTPISSITYGRSQIELMNIIAPDAVTLGNHEFDYGIDSLRTNIRRASYQLVSANIVDSTRSSTLVPASTVVTVGGAKLGVIGLAPPELELLTIRTNLRGLSLIDVDRALDEAVRELRSTAQPDLIVVLSHMGFAGDTTLAGRRNDIDVIVGGHSHTPLFSPVRKNRTLIVQAGSRGQYLGKLELQVDLSGDSVVSYAGGLLEMRTDAVTPNPLAAAKVAELESMVDSALNEVIGTLVTPWIRRPRPRGESNLGNWECDAVRRATGTDIAFLNTAGLRKNLDAGPVRARDIWEINPFGNTLVTFSVRGRTLRDMIERQTNVPEREFLQVSGLKYVYDSTMPEGRRLHSLEVGGEPLIEAKEYSISTNNYVASHLAEFFGIDERSVSLRDTGLIDRDVLIEAARSEKTISASVEGRIVDVGGTQ